MSHLLVDQLRFTRSEWLRAIEGLSDEDARRRLLPMNCISWMVGHLAWQENRYWLRFAQGKNVAPQLDDIVGYGRPASTPPLNEMQEAWLEVTGESDHYLDTLSAELLLTNFQYKGRAISESAGTLLQRVIYHYWFHTGEALAIRQMMGHADLPEFVGRFTETAHYRPE